MYFDKKATTRYLRRRHKLYKSLANYYHGNSNNNDDDNVVTSL